MLISIGVLFFFQMGFTYLSPLQTLFGTAAIGTTMWIRIVLVASSVLFLVELEKYCMRNWSNTALQSEKWKVK